MNIKISRELKKNAPDLHLGFIQYSVDEISENNQELWDMINNLISSIIDKYKIENIVTFSEVEELRSCYKNLGKKPSKYRGSSEALLRKKSGDSIPINLISHLF